MRISEVTIEKFRSIKKATFRMSDITAVVGENNAGKTAVLRALNAVLNYKNEEESFLNDYFTSEAPQIRSSNSMYVDQ